MNVKITWNNTGGELDSVTLHDVRNECGEQLTEALIQMLSGNLLAIGDSITVEQAA